MAGDTVLAGRVRSALESLGTGKIREVRMFGGIGFMLNGNLLLGASARGLLVRVGPQAQRKALTRAGARPMIMRGRTMEGYVYVDPPALNQRAVSSWVALAVEFVGALPPKVASKSRRSRPKT